jgi:hypothetical protein
LGGVQDQRRSIEGIMAVYHVPRVFGTGEMV